MAIPARSTPARIAVLRGPHVGVSVQAARSDRCSLLLICYSPEDRLTRKFTLEYPSPSREEIGTPPWVPRSPS